MRRLKFILTIIIALSFQSNISSAQGMAVNTSGSAADNIVAPLSRAVAFAIVQLAAGNTVSVKCSSITLTAITTSTDGSTQLHIAKL